MITNRIQKRINIYYINGYILSFFSKFSQLNKTSILLNRYENYY